ncbi:MAG: GNAT family N-acetyltransferase [Bacteroidales bacterium]|nr:GNAT family N-acetyltransferase [Bacteroidales bacterium]
MEIRQYESVYLEQMAQLFHQTVHTVNIRDYTQEQVNAWATGNVDLERWDASFRSHLTYVAIEEGLVVGFGDIDETGYLDMLYVHKDFQGKGIAGMICDRLENETEAEAVLVHASVTAKPFFEKRGYKTLRHQDVERQGVLLRNFVMVKDL